MTKSKRIRMLPALLALCVALSACGGDRGTPASDGGAGQGGGSYTHPTLPTHSRVGGCLPWVGLGS